MNGSYLGQVAQHRAASSSCPTTYLQSGKPAALPVIHELEEHGFVVPLAMADNLHISTMNAQNVLLRSLALQIKSGIGELDRRNKIRTILALSLGGMSTGRASDPKVAVCVRGNKYTVAFKQPGKWSVTQRLTLTWEGRNGVVLSKADCHSAFDIHAYERDSCAAWFEKQRVSFERHFTRKLAVTPADVGAKA